VYLYEFTGRPYFSPKPEYISADHGDDIPFAFGWSRFSEAYSLKILQEDAKTAFRIEEVFMQYLISFAKTGVPSGDGLPLWRELREGGSYMQINADPQLKQNYKPEQLNLWLKTLPTLKEEATRDEL
jgi:carboxylesterase type B